MSNPAIHFQSKFLKKLKEDNSNTNKNNAEKKQDYLNIDDKNSQIKLSQNNSINDSNLQLLSNNLFSSNNKKPLNIFNQQELEMKDLIVPLNKLNTKKSNNSNNKEENLIKSQKSEKSMIPSSQNSFSKNSSLNSSIININSNNNINNNKLKKNKDLSAKSFAEDEFNNLKEDNFKRKRHTLVDDKSDEEDSGRKSDFRKLMKREKIVFF